MNQARWIKATNLEILQYRNSEPKPVYPLVAWIRYNGNKFPVEQCGALRDKNNPVYEVMCIEGMMFSEGVHTLLEYTQKGCVERVEMNNLEVSNDIAPAKPVDPIEDAIAQFPATFGLRAFPGNVFRISQRASYVNDSKVIQLYTQIFTCDKWLDFAKGTVSELKAELVGLPVDPSAEFDGLMDIQIESPSIFLGNAHAYLQTLFIENALYYLQTNNDEYNAMRDALSIIYTAKSNLDNAAEWKAPRLESSLGTDSPEQEAIIAKTAEPTSEPLTYEETIELSKRNETHQNFAETVDFCERNAAFDGDSFERRVLRVAGILARIDVRVTDMLLGIKSAR